MSRYEWVLIEDNLKRKNIGLDLFNTRIHASKFYRLIKIREKSTLDDLRRLMSARRFLESVITSVKGIIQPEVNGYIRDIEEKFQSYRWFVGNIGRINGEIDLLQSELRKIENAAEFLNDPVAPVHINNYKNFMEVIMESLITNPLIKAHRKFLTDIKKDGKEVKKDIDLFSYLLFLEIFNASEVLGGITRQKPIAIVQRGKEIVSPETSPAYSERKYPPETPINPRLEEYQEEEFIGLDEI